MLAQSMRVLDVQLTMVRDGDKTGLAVQLELEAGPASLYAWNAEETAIAAVPAIPRAEVPFFATIPKLFGWLINPNAELGTLRGWEPVIGTWSVETTDPRVGTYHFAAAASTDTLILANRGVLQVDPGDRILAQGFVRRTGSAGGDPREVRVTVEFLDANGDAIVGGDIFGPWISSTTYTMSRARGVAPAGAVAAQFLWESHLVAFGLAQGLHCDGAYMVVIPKDSDIDVLLTQNAPVDSGAEVNIVPGSYVPDPIFRRGTALWPANADPDVPQTSANYWAKLNLTSNCSIVAGEGVGGGNVLRLEEDNNGLQDVWSIPRIGSSEWVTGSHFLVQARWRKRDSTVQGPAALLDFRVGANNSPTSNLFNKNTDLQGRFLQTDINAWVVDEWQTLTYVSEMLLSAEDDDVPYIVAGVSWDGIDSPMRIDIDFLMVTQVYIAP